MREVLEETACEGRIGPLAGAAIYRVGARQKVVVYWHMELVREHPFSPGEEVDEIAWVTPAQALRLLDHEAERRLVPRRTPRPPRSRADEP